MSNSNPAYSLRLSQAPDSTNYIAVSYCWSEFESATRPPGQPRHIDPNRPEIPLDLDNLQSGKAPLVWDFYTNVPEVQSWAILNSQTQKCAKNLVFLTLSPDMNADEIDIAHRVSVYSLNGTIRQSKASRTILNRAVRFAVAHDLGLIWIDKECIDQDNRDDKEVGIQSMDLVYQRSRYPIGIISDVEITTQHELDVFTKMISNDSLTETEWSLLGILMHRIVSSKFFTRAWICQELHAGGCTTLLVQCSPLLLRNNMVVGPTPGEVEIRLDYSTYGIGQWRMLQEKMHDVWLMSTPIHGSRPAFPQPYYDIHLAWDELRAYVTGASLALSGSNDEWGANKNPDARQKYNIRSGLTRLGDKKNSVSSERLTILANICNFRTKLNTKGLADFTFSTCLMALALMNDYWDCIFTPSRCQALEAIERRWFTIEHMSRIDESGLYIDHIWRQHPKKELRALHCADEGGALKNAQWFLTVDESMKICKGRLWVTDVVLNLQHIRATILDMEQSSSSAQEDVIKYVLGALTDIRNGDGGSDLAHLLVSTFMDSASQISTESNAQSFRVQGNSSNVFSSPSSTLDHDVAWILKRIREKGFICFSSCLDFNLELMPGTRAITDMDGIGVPFFEYIAVGPSEERSQTEHWRFWMTDRFIWQWPNDSMGSVHTTAGDVVQPSRTPTYVVRCVENSGRVVGGSPVRLSETLAAFDKEAEDFDLSVAGPADNHDGNPTFPDGRRHREKEGTFGEDPDPPSSISFDDWDNLQLIRFENCLL